MNTYFKRKSENTQYCTKSMVVNILSEYNNDVGMPKLLKLFIYGIIIPYYRRNLWYFWKN